MTWRQEVGGSAIEASKIAVHASTKITEEYTVVQLKRQEDLTRRIQDKLAATAAKKEVTPQAAATTEPENGAAPAALSGLADAEPTTLAVQ